MSQTLSSGLSSFWVKFFPSVLTPMVFGKLVRFSDAIVTLGHDGHIFTTINALHVGLRWVKRRDFI